ncbi:MAG TPA: glycosyltransferase family 2 protein [Gammaproteobacteria bacterium]|nr:glycosyltransferase family 2 protein [Gammaproteobacteria bacterium]
MITRDAAPTLAESLDSLAAFAEIVVFDNGSGDDTVEIARRYRNVRVSHGEFKGFGPTKNEAVALAANDWVFVLDSDEIASEALIDSLRSADLGDPACVYFVERHNYFMGRRVRHSGWGRDWLPRLYHRARHRYSDAQVHEKVATGPGSRPRRLAGPLRHLAVRELGQFLSKVDCYSALRGREDRRVQGPPATFLRAGWAFFRSYVLLLGFLDGWRGLVIAWSNANGVFFKYMRPYAERMKAGGR